MNPIHLIMGYMNLDDQIEMAVFVKESSADKKHINNAKYQVKLTKIRYYDILY